MDQQRFSQVSDLFAQLFERGPSMQLIVDAATGWVVDANESLLAFRACAIDDLRRIELDDFLIMEPADRELSGDPLSDPVTCTFARLYGADGCWYPVEVDAARLDGADHRRLLHLALRDRSGHVRTELQLQCFEEFYERLPVPLYQSTSGASGQFVRFNAAFLRLLDADHPDQLLARNISDFYVDPDERTGYSDLLMRDGEMRGYALRMFTLTGRRIECIDTAFRHEDENGRVVFDGVLEDVTRQRKLEQELVHQARYDALTQLNNRRYCDQLLAAEIERCERYGQRLSLLMLDLDHFKQVNDEHGHAVGDNLLQLVATCIRDHARQTDITGRWGGEEFLLMLPLTSQRAAASLAERLRHAIAALARANSLEVTVSIGCGEYRDGDDCDIFLGQLDEALYTAKSAGRDCVSHAHTLEIQPRTGYNEDDSRKVRSPYGG